MILSVHDLPRLYGLLTLYSAIERPQMCELQKSGSSAASMAGTLWGWPCWGHGESRLPSLDGHLPDGPGLDTWKGGGLAVT
jgi:hypothetical protein